MFGDLLKVVVDVATLPIDAIDTVAEVLEIDEVTKPIVEVRDSANEGIKETR